MTLDDLYAEFQTLLEDALFEIDQSGKVGLYDGASVLLYARALGLCFQKPGLFERLLERCGFGWETKLSDLAFHVRQLERIVEGRSVSRDIPGHGNCPRLCRMHRNLLPLHLLELA